MGTLLKTCAGAMAAIALTACVPTAPSTVEATVSPPAAATASATPERDGFSADDVADALAALPAPSGQEWDGGRASEIAGNTQSGWGWASTEPEPCLIFVNGTLLTFVDDIDSDSQDRIFTASLNDAQGPGPEDDIYHAYLTVRVLEDAARAQTDVFDAVGAAGPSCSAYTATTTGLEWELSNVSELVVHDGVSVAGADQAVGVTYHESQADMARQAVVWAVVDNVLFVVSTGENDERPADHDFLAEAVSVAETVAAQLIGG